MSVTELAILRLIQNFEKNQQNLKRGHSVTLNKRRIEYTANETLHRRDPSLKFVLFVQNNRLESFKNVKSYQIIYDIQNELLHNNPLWICKHKITSQVRKALNELEALDYMVGIHGKDVYYINPGKISNGNPTLVIYALSYHLLQKRKVYLEIDETDVIALKAPPPNYEPDELKRIVILELLS